MGLARSARRCGSWRRCQAAARMTASRAPRILCVGEAMLELASLDLAAGTARASVAGDVYNTAVYLKRMLPEAEVAFATALGRDALSEAMLGRMATEGLSTAHVARLADRAPGLYAVSVDAQGERSFAYWRSQSAARAMLGPGGLDLDAIEAFDALYLSGITLAILPAIDRARLVALAGRMRAQGRLVAFDSNYRPLLWAGENEARAAIGEMWAVASLALPSRDDEAHLHGPESPGALFRRLGAPEAVLKDGAAGPWTWDGTKAWHHPLPRVPRVLDTTAAGDGFNAAYLAARLRGESPEAAVRAGHALAAHIIGHPGAIMPMPA